jgi:hypothetical protein
MTELVCVVLYAFSYRLSALACRAQDRGLRMRLSSLEAASADRQVPVLNIFAVSYVITHYSRTSHTGAPKTSFPESIYHPFLLPGFHNCTTTSRSAFYHIPM